MKLPSESKFRRWKWVELARYVPDLNRVIREQVGPKDHKTPVIVEWESEDIDRYRWKHNNVGLYTSVFHYDDTDPAKSTRLGSLYFDFDADEVRLAQRNTARLVEYLYDFVDPSAVRIYFTGKKGFHVECEAVHLGVGPSNNLPGIFRFIASSLKSELELQTIDFAVYDLRRMWRLPNSRHQHTGLHKVELTYDQLTSSIRTIESYAEEPHFEVAVPDQKFSATANEWYRNWVIMEEMQRKKLQMTPQDAIDRFEKYGARASVRDADVPMDFDPVALFEGCPAILRHWETAERTHDLSHEARLFLCSILTYSNDAIGYLHAILSNCDDYNFEKTQAHIDDWLKRREYGIGGRPYSCRRANEAGVGCGSCELEPKEKWVRVGDKMIRTGETAEPSPVRYAYGRKREKSKK